MARANVCAEHRPRQAKHNDRAPWEQTPERARPNFVAIELCQQRIGHIHGHGGPLSPCIPQFSHCARPQTSPRAIRQLCRRRWRITKRRTSADPLNRDGNAAACRAKPVLGKQDATVRWCAAVSTAATASADTVGSATRTASATAHASTDACSDRGPGTRRRLQTRSEWPGRVRAGQGSILMDAQPAHSDAPMRTSGAGNARLRHVGAVSVSLTPS